MNQRIPGLFLLACVLSYVLVSCTEFNSEEEQPQITEQLPDQESWNTKTVLTREGKMQALIIAGYVAKYTGKKETVLEDGIKVDFYDSEGKLKSVLTAQRGKIFDNRQDMVAEDSVVVKAQNGTNLYTEELWWDNEKAKITSEVPVMITTETDTIYGDTFVSDPDLVEYEITNPRGSMQKTIRIDE